MTDAPIAIEVLLPALADQRFFAGASLPSAAAELQRYADGLIAQLDLPVAARVELREAPADAARFLPGERFRLSIGGVPARLSLEVRSETGDGLVAASEGVFENRTLLVREADLAQFRQRGGASSATFSDFDLLRGLRRLVELGVRTSRLDVVAAGTGWEQAVDSCHDEALAVAVQIPAGRAGLAQTLGEQLRDIWGIPLPLASFEVTAMPARWHRLRINDVWLPASPTSAESDIVFELQRHLSLFVSAAAVDFLLSSLARGQEPLVRAVRERLPRPTLVEVFRSLIAEGISLAPLRDVLETMLVAHGRTPASDAGLVVLGPHTGGILPKGQKVSDDPLLAAELVELVRARDNRSMRMQLLGTADDPLPVIIGTAAFEADLITAPPPLDGDARRALVRRIAVAIESAGHVGGAPRIIVVSSRARRPLRDCIAREFPSVRVVSWSELPDDAGIRAEAHLQ